MNKKYIEALAEYDNISPEVFEKDTYGDIVASGAIFFATVGFGCNLNSSDLAEETGLPKEQVERIIERLHNCGYIKEGKIFLNLPTLDEKSVRVEFSLFCLAGGTGVVQKI